MMSFIVSMYKKVLYCVCIAFSLIFLLFFASFFLNTPISASPTSLTVQVASSTDDANQDNTTLNLTDNKVALGRAGAATTTYSGLRFTNITIPQGAIITSARLQVYSIQLQSNTISVSIAAEAIGNSPTFSTTNKISQRALTAQKIPYTTGVTPWQINTWYTLDDMTPVLQEVINRADWKSGNSISFIIKGEGTAASRRYIRSWNGSKTLSPKLLITYDNPAPTATPTPTPVLIPGESVYHPIGTPTGSNGGFDAVSWSPANPLIIDKYGNYIAPTQYNGGSYRFAYSNDQGVTWSEVNPGIFLFRMTASYDSINDKLHVVTTSNGIVYRQFNIVRDANLRITNITPDTTFAPLLLDGSSGCSVLDARNPLVLWKNAGVNGVLAVLWSVTKTCGSVSITESRGTMRILSNTSADGVASNWKALNGISDAGGAVGPASVSYNKLYGFNGSATPFQHSALLKESGAHVNDLYYFSIDQNDTHGFRRLEWNPSASNWSGTWTTRALFGGNVNDSQGYPLKKELLSKPVLDTARDRVYVGIARWLDNTNGDTNSLYYVDALDAVSLAGNVYSAGGAHCLYPTFDLSYDSVTNKIYYFYDNSGDRSVCGNVQYKSYDGTTFSTPYNFYTVPNRSVDIPVTYPTSINNRILLFFRLNNAVDPNTPPHEIYFGFVPFIAEGSPTPTPTITPPITPTATPTVSPPQGLQNWWKLDESNGIIATDSAGNAIGTWNGTGGTRWGAGQFGGAGIFNGTDDFIDTGNVSAANSGTKLTISYWIKPTVLVPKQGQIAKSDFTALATNNTFAIRTQNDLSNELFVFFFSASDPGNNYFATTDAALTAGMWQLLTIVYDGTGGTNSDRLKIYKNGVQLNGTFSGSIPVSLNSSTASLTFGRKLDNSGFNHQFYSGSMDDIRLYNFALSSSQVQALYAGGNP